ncbi:MAG: DUF429 domain-containing protein [Rubrivivax sp.]|nr:MAG: DUF429 domain-containing protein [Rubrivivax sp.]
MGHTAPEWLLGLDFTCAPTARKPITLAWGRRHGAVLKLERVEAIPSLDAFEALAMGEHPGAPAQWLGGFDFPFGLPRVFVDALYPDLLTEAQPYSHTLIRRLHAQCGTRQGFQALIDGWGQSWGQGTRPATLPHRRTDTAIPGVSSTSPLQTRYVPVGKMYFEGLWRLVQAGVSLPGLDSAPPASDATLPPRLALEAYPGLLSTEILGRQSYKSDARDGRDDPRLLQRLTLIDALEQGRTRLGLRLKLSPAQRDHLASDAQGDRLDAVLCLLQAAWAHAQHEAGDPRWGLPADLDPVEGWILGT